MAVNILNTPDFDRLASEFEQDRGLPAGSLRAVAHKESRGNSAAVSPKGAQGTFQFMPATAKQYNVDTANPWDSMRGAADYLGDLTKQYGGNFNAALAHYNGGGSQAQAVINQGAPTFAETKDYVSTISAAIGSPAAPATSPVRPTAPPTATATDPATRQAQVSRVAYQVARAKIAGHSDDDIVRGLVDSPTLGAQVKQAMEAGYSMAEIVSTAGGKPLADVLADKEKYNPTKDMSALDRGLAGAGKAVADTIHGAKQLGARVFGSDADVERLRAEQVDRQQIDAPLMDTTAGKVGNVAGHVGMFIAGAPVGSAAGAAANVLSKAGTVGKAASALPRAAQVVLNPTSAGQMVASGAAHGALAPTKTTSETVQNTLLGGAAGAAGGLFAGGRAFKPSARAQELIDQGVVPTFGQAGGRVLNAVEEKLTSVPLVGDVIAGARSRAVDDLNVAALKRAAPEGTTITKPGYEAISEISTAFKTGYDDILGSSTVRVGPQLGTAWSNVQRAINDKKLFLSAAERQQLLDIVAAHYQTAIGTGTATSFSAAAAKSMTSEIKNEARSLALSSPAAAKALNKASELIDDWWKSSSNMTLTQRSKLRELDGRYANFIRVQEAAKSSGAVDGVFSPNALRQAVRKTDSGNKTAFSKGEALMQDLADSGRTVLGNKIADSGTASRLLGNTAGLGGLGYGLAVDPLSAAAVAGAGYVGTKALYSKAALKHLMTTSRNRELISAGGRGAAGAIVTQIQD